MRNFLLIALCCLFTTTLFSQTIENDWQFSEIKNQGTTPLFNLDPNQDYLKINDGRFEYRLQSKDSIKASGDYIYQNNLLVFFYDTPKNTIRRYRVKTLTDSSLVFSKNQVQYHL